MVSVCIYMVEDFPRMVQELNLTFHGPIKSTWTSSHGDALALAGRGIFPYFFKGRYFAFLTDYARLHIFLCDCIDTGPVKAFLDVACMHLMPECCNMM
jgi:hypothetical protein